MRWDRAFPNRGKPNEPERALGAFQHRDRPLALQACLVNMAMFSRHPYTIICADALRIDEKYAYTTSPIWDMGNLWDPPDFTLFYWKEPPITAQKFSLAEWTKIKHS